MSGPEFCSAMSLWRHHKRNNCSNNFSGYLGQPGRQPGGIVLVNWLRGRPPGDSPKLLMSAMCTNAMQE